MSNIIRIGLVVAAVVLILAMIVGFKDQLVDGISAIGSAMGPILVTIMPYLQFGRKLCNLLVGFPAIIDIVLWSEIVLTLLLHNVKLVSRVLSKLIGK